MIKIELMYDWNDCDHAGCSGGDAYGGRIYIDGVLKFEHVPEASCFGSESYEPQQMLIKAIELLGHEVVCE